MPDKNINSTLEQYSRSTGEKRRFEIFNDKFIKVRTQSPFGTRSYEIKLSLLEPWPIRHQRISWPWLASLVYFSLATLAYSLYLYNHPTSDMLEKLVPFITLFSVLTIGSLTMLLYYSPNVTEFRGRYTGAVLLQMFQNKPDKTSFRQFIGEIKTRCLLASQEVILEKGAIMELELGTLRNLREKNIISEDSYFKATSRASRYTQFKAPESPANE